jgi:tRNA-dihydrouridine synthase A
MAEPDLVAAAVAAMQNAAGDIPVTVKCRIGIDDQDSEADLDRFVRTVASAGCSTFIVHARKAWLQGLSPKENRDVPPLDHGRVVRLKQAYPHLTISMNGGIGSLDEAVAHLEHVDGVMLGRAAYHTPYLLAQVDQRIFGDISAPVERREVIERLMPYIAAHLAAGGKMHSITRHVLGLYHGEPGARAFRRHLSGGNVSLAELEKALTAVDRRGTDPDRQAAA